MEELIKSQSIVELPFTSEMINIRDLTAYIRAELNAIKRNVTDSVLQALSTSVYQQLDKQNQLFFLLRLVLNESYFSYLLQRKKKLDLSDLNIEEILNAYLGKKNHLHECNFLFSFKDHCERKFGPSICSSIFNYISSSQSAIHELELIDILSCNNEFFFEYFQKDLPKHLRFPPSLWIAVKSILGKSNMKEENNCFVFCCIVEPLLAERYFDLKVVICWRHSFIRRHMKQKYLRNVDDIRLVHRDIANYFLESFIESKPLIDLSKNVQIRYFK